MKKLYGMPSMGLGDRGHEHEALTPWWSNEAPAIGGPWTEASTTVQHLDPVETCILPSDLTAPAALELQKHPQEALRRGYVVVG